MKTKTSFSIDIGQLSRELPNHDALLALLSFAEHQDMVRAARALSLSQPALSFHLKKLELQVGFPIFAFSGKRKVLTRMGVAYAKAVTELFHGFHHSTIQLSKEALALDGQTIRIAGRRELLLPLLAFPFPGKIEWIQTTSHEALPLLRHHQVDLAVSAHVEEASDFMAKVFFESGFKIIAPLSWPKPISDSDLFSRPVVAYGNHFAFLREFAEAKGRKISELRISRIVEDWFSVSELVRHGFGWSVIPEAWEIRSDQLRETKIHGVDRLKSQKVFLFYRREDRKGEWMKSLEDWLKSRHA